MYVKALPFLLYILVKVLVIIPFWGLIFNIWFQAQASICVSRSLRWWEKTLKPNMVEIHSANELVDSLLNAGDRLVIVDFYSPFCGGCKTLHPKVYFDFWIVFMLRNLSHTFLFNKPITNLYYSILIIKLWIWILLCQICQLAELNPNAIILKVNHDELKAMCHSLRVHVLPFFRFYRGAEGRLCSFSCTNATVSFSLNKLFSIS